MSVHTVGDAAMVGAFDLIGVPGRVLEREQDLPGLLTALARDEGATLLFVQTRLAHGLSADLRATLLARWRCLVTVVPGPGEPMPDVMPLLRRVRGVLGAVT